MEFTDLISMTVSRVPDKSLFLFITMFFSSITEILSFQPKLLQQEEGIFQRPLCLYLPDNKLHFAFKTTVLFEHIAGAHIQYDH